MQILNLGSRHAGLEGEIASLIHELRSPARLQAAFPTLDPAAVLARLDDLPYVILVGPDMLTITERVFHCEPGSDLSQGDPLLSMLEDAENAADCDNNEPRDREPRGDSTGFDVDYGAPFDSSNNSSASTGSRGARPRRSVGAPDVATIVIDCYGMYLPSLRAWLDKVSHKLPAPAARLAACLVDGPAVAICPETLADLPEAIMRSAALHVRRSLSPAGFLTQLALKLTLYHEIGHHVFPIHDGSLGDNHSADRTYLAEALANWFVYCVSDARERAVLLEGSSLQSREYRAYRGLVWLELAAADIVAVPGMDGPGWVGAIEQASFNGQLRGPVIDDELDRRPGGCIYELDEILRELIHHPHRRRFWELLMHRAPLATNHACRAYGQLLVRAAAPRRGGRLQKLADELLRGHPLRPASRNEQRAWLDRAAQFPRRLPG